MVDNTIQDVDFNCEDRIRESAKKIRETTMDEFWEDKVQWYKEGDPNQVIYNGTHYHIADEGRGGSRGHGGRKFIITFNDGRVVTTTNLWYQGTIDCPVARAILQDNTQSIIEDSGPCIPDGPDGLPF